MSMKRKNRYIEALRSLPELFDLQPVSDYRRFFSRNARELNKQAWEMTAAQWKKSLEDINKSKPDLQRMTQEYLAIKGEESILEQQSREFDDLVVRIEQQQREFEWQWAAGPDDGGAGAPTKRRSLFPT